MESMGLIIDSNQKKYIRIIADCSTFLGVIVLLFLLLQDREMINDSVIVVSFFLFVSIGINIVNRKQIVFSIKNMICSLFLSILFYLQLSVFEFKGARCFWNSNHSFVHKLWILFILVIIFFNFFISIIHIFRHVTTKEVLCGQFSKEKYLYCRMAIIAESIVFLLSTYPGIWLRDDVDNVYSKAIMNQWQAWHTIGYMWFVKLCTLIYESQYTVNIIQTIVWIILNLYILSVLKNISVRCMYIYTVVLCFSFIPFLYLEIMFKDTVFSMGVMALTVSLFKVVYSSAIDKRDIAILVTIPLFALLCRHGSIIPIQFTLVVLVVYLYKKVSKKLSYIFLGLVVYYFFIYLLVNVILASAFHVVPNSPAVKYGTPIAMVGAAVHYDIELTDEEINIIEQYIPREKWKDCYNKYLVDDLARVWGKVGSQDANRLEDLVRYDNFGIDMLKINAKLAIHHPIVYFRAFFDMNSMVWEITKPHDSSDYIPSAANEDSKISYPLAYRFTDTISDYINGFPVTRAILARGGFALFLLIFTSIVLLLKRKELLISILPIIIIDALLLFTMPMQDFRYVLPTLEVAIFFVSVLLSGFLNRKSAEK